MGSRESWETAKSWVLALKTTRNFRGEAVSKRVVLKKAATRSRLSRYTKGHIPAAASPGRENEGLSGRHRLVALASQGNAPPGAPAPSNKRGKGRRRRRRER